MKTTGIDASVGIPVGATITRTYWSVPTHGTIGEPHHTQEEALTAAIRRLRANLASHTDHYPNPDHRVALPEQIVIDHRWAMQYPDGGAIDTIATRYTYESLGDAACGLERLTSRTNSVFGTSLPPALTDPAERDRLCAMSAQDLRNAEKGGTERLAWIEVANWAENNGIDSMKVYLGSAQTKSIGDLVTEVATKKRTR